MASAAGSSCCGFDRWYNIFWYNSSRSDGYTYTILTQNCTESLKSAASTVAQGLLKFYTGNNPVGHTVSYHSTRSNISRAILQAHYRLHISGGKVGEVRQIPLWILTFSEAKSSALVLLTLYSVHDIGRLLVENERFHVQRYSWTSIIVPDGRRQWLYATKSD